MKKYVTNLCLQNTEQKWLSYDRNSIVFEMFEMITFTILAF